MIAVGIMVYSYMSHGDSLRSPVTAAVVIIMIAIVVMA